MKKLLLAVGLLCLALPGTVFAQGTGAVAGVIMDRATGQPLPGANILIQGINRGTTADADGRYVLSGIAEGRYQIRFTYIGFRQVQRMVDVAPGVTTTLNVELEDDILGLEDIVVIGYTQVPKREVTGSIASIRSRDIEALNITSIDQAMQGMAAGVRVTNLSGTPGGDVHVRIRGLGSINASNAPLYVVDGVPITHADLSAVASSNALGGVNPADIASIEILKDAAAASIYGAQASNGVVIITTKRGSAGATRFNLSMGTGYAQPAPQISMLASPEWTQLQVEAVEWSHEFLGSTREAGRQRAIRDLGLAPYLDADGNIRYQDIPTTNWQDHLMRTGNTRRIDLSATGGTRETRFYLAGGMNSEEGTALGSDYRRLNFRANVDHQASDLLSLDMGVNLANWSQNGALEGNYWFGSPIFAGLFYRPIDPVFREDGSYDPTFLDYNPLQAILEQERLGRTNHLLANGSARLNLLPGLSFRSYYGVDYRNVRDRVYWSPDHPDGVNYDGYLFQADRQVTNLTTNQIFNYSGRILNNPISGLGGFEYRRHFQETMTAQVTGFPSGLFRTMNSAAEAFGVPGGFGTEFRMASFLGQVKYDIGERYLVSLTGRYDGSSRFGEDRRWGMFGSGALAWVISNEQFMGFSEPWLDDLKLRMSYGVTGNTDGISDFAARQLFTAPTTAGSYDGQPILRPSGLGNNLLTWEGAETANLGLDWTLGGGRFYGAVDVYRRDTHNLLLERTLPSDSGHGSLLENVGSIRNEGVELELGSILVDRAGFQWTSDFNITFHRNEILRFTDPDDEYIQVGGALYFRGQSLGTYFMYEFAGVNPADGRPMFYDRDGNITYTVRASIEDGDRKIIGNNLPDHVGGWNNRLSFRGVTLDALLQWNMGQLTNDLMSSFVEGNIFRGYGATESALQRWQKPGDMTHIERGYWWSSAYPGRTSGLTAASTRYLQDASYVRLKNLRLGYGVPAHIANRMGLVRATVYLQGTNLVTWTNYPGFDPEMVGNNTVVYPQPRMYTTGIEIGF
jgi:TonB-dependent starch-binding outer membrane protein SusC